MIYFSIIMLIAALVLTIISLINISKSMKTDDLEKRIARLERLEKVVDCSDMYWEARNMINFVKEEKFIDDIISRINRKQIRREE